jgi:hypothetical protein
MQNGIYQAGAEHWGVLNGTRYGPISSGDLVAVEHGHPERIISGEDAAVLALPSAPWYRLSEMGVSDWVFNPWAPVDLIPPDLRAGVLALDQLSRPTAVQWVAHVDHGVPLPTPTRTNGAGGGGLLPSFLRGSFMLAGHAVPKWLALVAVLVIIYVVRRG